MAFNNFFRRAINGGYALIDRITGDYVGYEPGAGTNRQQPRPQGYIVATWAELFARGGDFPYQLALATDLGMTGTSGVWFVWDNTNSVWRVMAEQGVLYQGTIILGALSASEQVLLTMTAPIGLLHKQRWGFELGLAKNGATDAMTAAALRIGTLGTTSDPLLGGNIGTPMTAAARTYGTRNNYEWASTTAVVKRGSGTNAGSFIGGSSSTVANTAYTTPDTSSTAIKLSVTATMAATTDKPQLESFRLFLLP